MSNAKRDKHKIHKKCFYGKRKKKQCGSTWHGMIQYRREREIESFSREFCVMVREFVKVE